MTNIDRSFEAALDAVLQSGKQSRDLGSRRDELLKKLVNIGYEHQFSPEDRVAARREVKEAITNYLGQSSENEEQ